MRCCFAAAGARSGTRSPRMQMCRALCVGRADRGAHLRCARAQHRCHQRSLGGRHAARAQRPSVRHAPVVQLQRCTVAG